MEVGDQEWDIVALRTREDWEPRGQRRDQQEANHQSKRSLEILCKVLEACLKTYGTILEDEETHVFNPSNSNSINLSLIALRTTFLIRSNSTPAIHPHPSSMIIHLLCNPALQLSLLSSFISHPDQLTSTGFLLKMTKLSALCIMNLVNLWLNNLSISSACLILMLNRMELTEGSMRTLSFSFLEMIRGCSRTSFEDLASTSGSVW